MNRYLLLLVTNGCYLINMAYEFKYVPLFCPIRPDRVAKSGDKNQIMVHNWTLLDGVLVDKVFIKIGCNRFIAI